MVSSLTTTTLGRNGSLADTEALFLKMYAGKVLETFQTECKMEGLIDVQTISEGKSFTFPVYGRAEAKYHLRGENMLDPANGYLNNIKFSEKVIFLDRPLVSLRATDDWDDMVNHWDSASRLATEQGFALARTRDKQILSLLYKATSEAPALTAEEVGGGATVGSAGTITVAGLSGPAFATKADAQKVIQGMGSAAAALAKRNCPMDEVRIAMSHEDYFAALSCPDSPFIALETNKSGPNGDISERSAINRVVGFQIFATNHMPSATGDGGIGQYVDDTDGQFNTYAAPDTNLRMLAFHKSAIGSVRRQGVTVERERKMEILGDVISTYFVEGHGILRPECAVAIEFNAGV